MRVQSISNNNNSNPNFTAIEKVRKFGGFKKDTQLADTILQKIKETEEIDTFCNKYNTTVLLSEGRVNNERKACVQIIYKNKPTQNKLKNVLHAVRDAISPRSVFASAKGETTKDAVEKLGEQITEETKPLRTQIWDINEGFPSNWM